MKKVVVVLPTFNEKDNLEKFVGEVFSQEKNMSGWQIEILISDGGSTDGTAQIADKLTQNSPRVHFMTTSRGLGIGLVKGHEYSLNHLHPDVMAQLDADGQVDASVLPELIEAIEDGYDLALGSRFVPGGRNELSLIRRLFTAGSSLVCRFAMGPLDIKEFTNSARAFTPALFKKINFNRIPWQEKTYIIMPSFLHEAVLAGAKYKEVPLVFKNRDEGYSKNKILNYTYDIIMYALDARLHYLGINIPVFRLTRRAKTLIKFGLVGFTGTAVDFLFFKMVIWSLNFTPPVARLISGEIAIINNFTLNNMWTFRYRKTKNSYLLKLFLYNIVAYGGVGIASSIMLLLHKIYGDGSLQIAGLNLAYNNFYFLVTIPPVMIWNFTVNHFITWKKHD